MGDRFARARSGVWEEMRFLFDDYVKKGERVLDLGCGNGRFYEIIKEKGAEYVGIDVSEKLIDLAKDKFPGVHFQTGEATDLPFADEYFDKIYAIALLHHIPSNDLRLRTLAEAKRVLKKKGLLILTVWNLWEKKFTRDLIFKYGAAKILRTSKLDFGDILMEWQGVGECYFHCFRKKELKKLVKKAGFSIIKSGTILVGGKSKKKKNIPTSNFFIVAESSSSS